MDLDDAELSYSLKKVKKSTPLIKKSIKNSQLGLNPKPEKVSTVDLKPKLEKVGIKGLNTKLEIML